MPFATWLRDYFRKDKKFGSRDRKEIAHVCYSYFRLGHAFRETDREERMLLSLFLVSDSPNFILGELKPGWNEMIHLSPIQKLEYLRLENIPPEIFPFNDALSKNIEAPAFGFSFLEQPYLFLRARPGKKETIIGKLNAAAINFEIKNGETIRLANGIKAEEIISIDEEAVVQDMNSQKVLLPLEQVMDEKKDFSVWDCCAASGGKSILVHDHFPRARITVSDVRPSILINLQKRFRNAGIKSYRSFTADIAVEHYTPKEKYDVVICDAPCSGSGTWSRTPEQLVFFDKEKIEYYATLQKKIAANALKAVRQGGYFLYITCSVFEKENESFVEWFITQYNLKCLSQQYFKGYEQGADTLFAALFLIA